MRFLASLLLIALVAYAGSGVIEFDDAPDFDALRAKYSEPTTNWPTPHIDNLDDHRELATMPPVSFPAGNPFSVEKATLGQKLFNDGALSRSGQIACASCHDADLGWSDGRKRSFGHNRQIGLRNAPSIENIGFNSSFFWDGRASTLEEQSLMPITDPREQAFSLVELESRLSQTHDYPALFKRAFGDHNITSDRIGKALATFQRTIVSQNSPFDWFLLSQQEQNTTRKEQLNKRLSNQALWGLHLFRTKARCINCHNGSTFSDNKFHNIGLTYFRGDLEDYGVYQTSGLARDKGKFKTPSLRGIFNTRPWMHNGQFFDIEGIINIYNAGGVRRIQHKDEDIPETSPLLKPLHLSDKEQKALIAFLKAITAPPSKPNFKSAHDELLATNTLINNNSH